MGPGVKYHVVTIAAIFFALAIGLVVGSLFMSPQVVAQQKSELHKLQVTLNQMDSQYAAEIKHYQEFAAEALPRLVRGKLAGSNVCIVQCGDYPEATNRLRETLSLAGATVTSVTAIGASVDRPDDVLSGTLAAAADGDAHFPRDRAGLVQAIADTLAYGGTTGDDTFAALDRARFVTADESGSYVKAAKYVVVISGSRQHGATRAAQVDVPLVRALQRDGVRVVVCEPGNAAASDFDAFTTLSEDTPTVAGVDTDAGLCAVVYALRGERLSSGAGDLVLPAPGPR